MLLDEPADRVEPGLDEGYLRYVAKEAGGLLRRAAIGQNLLCELYEASEGPDRRRARGVHDRRCRLPLHFGDPAGALRVRRGSTAGRDAYSGRLRDRWGGERCCGGVVC